MEKKKKEKKEVHINSDAFINYFKIYYDKDRPQVCWFQSLVHFQHVIHIYIYTVYTCMYITNCENVMFDFDFAVAT